MRLFRKRILIYSAFRANLFVEVYTQRKNFRDREMLLKFYKRTKKHKWKPYFECRTADMLTIQQVIGEMKDIVTK